MDALGATSSASPSNLATWRSAKALFFACPIELKFLPGYPEGFIVVIKAVLPAAFAASRV